MTELKFFEFTSVPFMWNNKETLFEAFNGNPFLMIYDLNLRKSIIGLYSDFPDESVSSLEKRVAGLKFDKTEYQMPYNCKYEAYPVFVDQDIDEKSIFEDISSVTTCDAKLIVTFIPADDKRAHKRTIEIEKKLSSAAIRETNSARPGVASVFSRSFQRDLFFDSGNLQMLRAELEGIKRAVLTNGILYAVSISIVKDEGGFASRYLKSKFNLPEAFGITPKGLIDLLGRYWDIRSRLFPSVTLSRLIDASGCQRISYPMKVVRPHTNNGVLIGSFLEGAVTNSDTQIKIDPTVLNLGFIITGLPGSGKTMEAMSVIDKVLAYYAPGQPNGKRPSIVVISPTDEWNGFAGHNGLARIRLFGDGVPINFFRPHKSDVRFYEDLAMILASASRAGPYQNPMEKCMLNAFRSMRGTKDVTDPVMLYDAIEESVVKFHARRTNTGVKYTKHGENIRSALEDLRNILNRSEYSVRNGIDLYETFRSGVVFDMSAVGTTMRPYLYALVLNQVYSYASDFDTNGDDELRLIICIEEAQTIFGTKNLAAVEDLKKRIQDFRKQGMAIVLLTHNVNDIDPGIRRLCQIKLYLRQAPDVAPIAVKDLVFSVAEEDVLVSKLKHLDSRVAAFSYVEKINGDKIAQDSMFIRTAECPDYRSYGADTGGLAIEEKRSAETTISIAVHNADYVGHGYYIRVLYLWEEVCLHKIDKEVQTFRDNLIKGKLIIVQLLDKKQRILSEKRCTAKRHMKIRISNGLMAFE